MPVSAIPANAVTASGSGLDPDISPANAAIQVDRVAAARHVSPAAIQALVEQYTQGRILGFLGEPRVDVLNLNIALDQKYPVPYGTRVGRVTAMQRWQWRAGGTESPPARAEAALAPRVLIVEDEPALLRALRINLRARGYDVATAAAGREALAEARRHPPDVVLLDLGLPDLDGGEVIRELRGWSRAPVIVLSGRAGSGDKIGALDAGADDYVTKPFDMEELLARLRAALRRGDRAPQRPPVFRIGRHQIDLGAHTIAGTGRPPRSTASHAHRVAAAGDPAGRPRAAGQLRPPAQRDLGARVRAQHPLSPVPHGRAAPQAGGRSAPPAPPAHRARHGLPLPAMSRGTAYCRQRSGYFRA